MPCLIQLRTVDGTPDHAKPVLCKYSGLTAFNWRRKPTMLANPFRGIENLAVSRCGAKPFPDGVRLRNEAKREQAGDSRMNTERSEISLILVP